MAKLDGKVAIVTGASRGVGKGIALGLCEAGAIVHITARTTVEGKSKGEDLPGSIHTTAAEAAALGGRCVAHECDHRDDAQVERTFGEIFKEHEKIDLLVNNVWGGYE